MCPVQCHVLRDQIAVADEMMLFHIHSSKIHLNDSEDLPQSFPPLWAGGVIHHVLGHQVIEH